MKASQFPNQIHSQKQKATVKSHHTVFVNMEPAETFDSQSDEPDNQIATNNQNSRPSLNDLQNTLDIAMQKCEKKASSIVVISATGKKTPLNSKNGINFIKKKKFVPYRSQDFQEEAVFDDQNDNCFSPIQKPNHSQEENGNSSIIDRSIEFDNQNLELLTNNSDLSNNNFNSQNDNQIISKDNTDSEVNKNQNTDTEMTNNSELSKENENSTNENDNSNQSNDNSIQTNEKNEDSTTPSMGKGKLEPSNLEVSNNSSDLSRSLRERMDAMEELLVKMESQLDEMDRSYRKDD